MGWEIGEVGWVVRLLAGDRSCGVSGYNSCGVFSWCIMCDFEWLFFACSGVWRSNQGHCCNETGWIGGAEV